MRVGSLFSGIGGLELGLERAGMEVVWQVEIDPYAQKVLEKHWPNVRRHSDVRDVGAHNLEPVDLICGGFPCQDISNAGRRAGIGGERSGLWAEFFRIVCEVRPRYVLVENVAALLVRGLDRVLGDLAAGGFDAEWDCIPAAAVGAPHRRDRLFVVAYARGELGRLQPKPKSGRGGSPVAGDDGAEEPVAHAEGNGRKQGRPLATEDVRVFGCGGDALARFARGGFWGAEPDVGRVAHGVPSRVDRLKCLGNAVVPRVAEFLGRRIMGVAHG